jgi:multiple sugar transport system permease protein
MENGVRKKKRIGGDFKAFLLLQGPFLLWWLILSIFPIGFGLIMGFFDYRRFDQPIKFVGFENFKYFFSNPVYTNALSVSVWLGLLCTALSMAISFAVALAIVKLPKGQGIVRTMWYVPGVTSIAAITQILMMFVDPVSGSVNRALAGAGLPVIDVSMKLGSAVLMIVFYTVWSGVGGGMIYWVAGLKSIDRQLYEAASIDGAGAGEKFLYITLPGLAPFFTYTVITGVIGAIQIYGQILFISGGDPNQKTQTLVFLIMSDSFRSLDIGMAGVSSLVILVFVFIFSYFYLKRMSAVFGTKENG